MRVRVWAGIVGLVFAHFFLHLGLELGRSAPDLLTLALLIGAREAGLGTAAGMGLLFGLLEDAHAVLGFGANVLAMTVVGVAASSTRDLFVGDSLRYFVAYLFFGKWLRDLLYWILVGEDVREPFVRWWLMEGSLSAFYMTVIGLGVLALTGAWRESLR